MLPSSEAAFSSVSNGGVFIINRISEDYADELKMEFVEAPLP
jgi:hypothetical protein